MLASIGSCATLDWCRESDRVPCVAVRAVESTSRIGRDESESATSASGTVGASRSGRTVTRSSMSG